MSSNLVFLKSELDKLDPVIYEPIIQYTWSRDIDLRSDVTLNDEFTSFRRSDYGFNGSTTINDIPFISQNTNQLSGVSISQEKITSPMYLAGSEVAYGLLEVDKANYLGINLETQKIEALQTQYQMSCDKMVYVGSESRDTAEHKCRGMLNADHVSGITKQDSAVDFLTESDPDKIVDAFNNFVAVMWDNAGTVIAPNTFLLPPAIFARLSTLKYSSNAERTVLDYLKEQCLSRHINGTAPNFYPVKYAATLGSDNKGRIMGYTRDSRYIRYPLAPIRRLETEVHSMTVSTPYIWGLGEVEFVYPETIGYLDKVSPSNTLMLKTGLSTAAETTTVRKSSKATE